MTDHDLKKSDGSMRNVEWSAFFVDAAAECPYGLDKLAVYHQGAFGRLSDEDMGCFLAAGYRRNGNSLYNMRCPDCRLCVPIRLRPARFQPNRNQRRVWKKNQDVAVEIGPLTISQEKLSLLQHFLSTRFPQGRSNAESYYSGFFITSISRCFEVRYRLGDQLLGVAIVDGASSWLNAVYFYFDCRHTARSLGTLNILTLVQICRNHNFEHLYLGYWIDGLPGMSYKSSFYPHDLLLNGTWKEENKEGLAGESNLLW